MSIGILGDDGCKTELSRSELFSGVDKFENIKIEKNMTVEPRKVSFFNGSESLMPNTMLQLKSSVSLEKLTCALHKTLHSGVSRQLY